MPRSNFHQLSDTTSAGQVTIIQPVWATAPSIHRAVESPVLRDLIAWHPDEPDLWFYCFGLGRPILGEDHYLDAIESGAPLKVFATPLDWLRAGGEGCVFLDDVESRWAVERAAEDDATVRDWWGAVA